MKDYPHRKAGRAIQVIRLLKDMTQMELAFHVGVNPSHISNIEKGCTAPSLDLLERIATALDVAAYQIYLLAEADQLNLVAALMKGIQ